MTIGLHFASLPHFLVEFFLFLRISERLEELIETGLILIEPSGGWATGWHH